MKYGIDIINEEINLSFLRKLEDSNIFIIDFSKIRGNLHGDSLQKKVLLANQTKIDVYISIRENLEDSNSLEILRGDSDKEVYFENILKNQIENIDWKMLKINNEKKLYLIKNIKSPTIIINISKTYSPRNLEKLINLLVNKLVSIF